MSITQSSPDSEIVRLINVLRADEGDSVEILCDNPDFNGQPNCAIVCCGDWTGWLHKRFAADTLLDALSMAMVEKNLPSPRKVIATSNGHHWIERFNLVCCRDCGFVRRADDQNAICKGQVGIGIRRDLLPPSPSSAGMESACKASFDAGWNNAVEECVKTIEDYDTDRDWSADEDMQNQAYFTAGEIQAELADLIRGLAPSNGVAQAAWKCLAPSKAACAWPDCGCDPEATKVIKALVDQGWQAPAISSTNCGGGK